MTQTTYPVAPELIYVGAALMVWHTFHLGTFVLGLVVEG